MNAKDGKSCTLESPIEPMDAVEAIEAEAGAVDEFEFEAGEGDPLSLTPVSIGRGESEQDEEEQEEESWISIELRDANGKPVKDEKYEITPPGEQSARTGTTDARGKARVDGIKSGTCKVTFPDIHAAEWKKI